MLAGNNNNNIVETKQTTAVASSLPLSTLFSPSSVASLPHHTVVLSTSPVADFHLLYFGLADYF